MKRLSETTRLLLRLWKFLRACGSAWLEVQRKQPVRYAIKGRWLVTCQGHTWRFSRLLSLHEAADLTIRKLWESEPATSWKSPFSLTHEEGTYMVLAWATDWNFWATKSSAPLTLWGLSDIGKAGNPKPVDLGILVAHPFENYLVDPFHDGINPIRWTQVSVLRRELMALLAERRL